VELIAGNQTQPVSGGVLEKQLSVSPLSWTVRATTHGVKNLTVEGSGGTLGETFTAGAPVSFTADCKGPAVSFGSGPSGSTTDRTPTFGFSADEPAGLECSIDGAVFATCTSPVTTATLALGSHSFRVRGTDALGNVGAAATRAFTVADDPPPPDNRKPTSTILSGPKSPGNDRTPTFTFAADEPADFECSQEGNVFEPCRSPHSTSKLFDGSYAFQVRATDSAGNREANPVSREFTIDTKIKSPGVDANAKQRRRKSRIMVKLKAGAGEAVEIKGKGKILLAGRDARLAPKSKNVKANKRKTLKLEPARKKDAERVQRALAAGKKPRAKLSVRLVDRAGNKRTERLGIRIQP
jgi:hypothetical protein